MVGFRRWGICRIFFVVFFTVYGSVLGVRDLFVFVYSSWCSVVRFGVFTERGISWLDFFFSWGFSIIFYFIFSEGGGGL